jgi:hypothetical protein
MLSITFPVMLQRFFTIVCVVLSVSSISPVYAEVSAPKGDGLSSEEIKISSKNSAIGGIKLDMSGQQVRRILGKPLKRKRIRAASCGEAPTTTLYDTYKNIKVELGESDDKKTYVHSIETTSRFYHTDKGIRVGDSIAKAKVAYPTLQESSNNDGMWFSYQTLFAVATNKQGIITKITLGFDSGC